MASPHGFIVNLHWHGIPAKCELSSKYCGYNFNNLERNNILIFHDVVHLVFKMACCITITVFWKKHDRNHSATQKTGEII